MINNNHQALSHSVDQNNFYYFLHKVFDKFGIMLNIPVVPRLFLRPNFHIRFHKDMMRYFDQIGMPFGNVPAVLFHDKKILWREIDLFSKRLQFVDGKGNYLELNFKPNLPTILQNEERKLKLQRLDDVSESQQNNYIDYETFFDFSSNNHTEFSKWFTSSIKKALLIRKNIPVPHYVSGQIGLNYMAEGDRINFYELIKYLNNRHIARLLRSQNQSGLGYISLDIVEFNNMLIVRNTSFNYFQIRHQYWGLGYKNVNINDFIFFKCLYINDSTSFRGWMKK